MRPSKVRRIRWTKMPHQVLMQKIVIDFVCIKLCGFACQKSICALEITATIAIDMLNPRMSRREYDQRIDRTRRREILDLNKVNSPCAKTDRQAPRKEADSPPAWRLCSTIAQSLLTRLTLFALRFPNHLPPKHRAVTEKRSRERLELLCALLLLSPAAAVFSACSCGMYVS